MGKIKRSRFSFLAVSGLAVFLFSGLFDRKAYAYLDPGTGNYFIQLALALLLGALCALRGFWGKLKKLFQEKFGPRQKK